MKMISSFSGQQKGVSALFLLVVLVLNTYKIQENSARIKHLTNFENGMQTCFSRVNQTYTAKMMEDTSSNYLTQNFQNLTEECFAESVLNIEERFKAELPQITKRINTMASNVHWFHEDVLSPDSTGTITKNSESRDVGARFERIETTKDEIFESSDKYKTEINNSLNDEKTIFYVSATLLFLLMAGEFLKNTRLRLSRSAREKEAAAELMDHGGVNSVKIGEIIKSALVQNDLINCSQLFANYHAHQSFDRSIRNKGKISLEKLVTPVGVPTSADLNDKIDKIWNDDNLGVATDTTEEKMYQTLNLENINSNIVDILSEKLFSQGVKLDVKIPENLMIRGRAEELEQIFYHLINFAINSTHSDKGERNISIFAHLFGDIVAYDLIYSGSALDEGVMRTLSGGTAEGNNLDIDLQICQSLLSELGAKIQLDNKLNQNGEITGGRIKIIFKAGSNISSNRLVDLKVGSKKEILRSINQSQSEKSF